MRYTQALMTPFADKYALSPQQSLFPERILGMGDTLDKISTWNLSVPLEIGLIRRMKLNYL
ncbi:hypothetical protein FACS1894110_16370 [Spirochaetia bacterium]|nr:hypothetical protein FACS1894110_16370 [Spirochaetia bacterium]